MCGIAGTLFKDFEATRRDLTAGQALINMLDGCQHRGPDSTGFALYRDSEEGSLQRRYWTSGTETFGSCLSSRAKIS